VVGNPEVCCHAPDADLLACRRDLAAGTGPASYDVCQQPEVKEEQLFFWAFFKR
jgi:hypothetical protein